MSTLPRLTLATLAASLLLAGCADKKVVSRPVAETPATSRATTAASTAVDSTGGTTTHRSSKRVRTVRENLPDHTGIAACDDYLSSYLACHRAAAIYTPDQLPMRYQAMRSSLLRDSQNPDIRPQLEARCNSLATQLREALHGKSCAESPAPASTTP
jgi:hypothetical protein